MKTKRIALVLFTVLLFATLTTVFVACDGGSGNKELDDAIKSGKLILNVATYDGGIGTDWIKQSKTEFEALYANTKFGDKTGVYVNTVGNKQMGGNTIENDSLKYDVYFTEMVNYYSFVNKGKLADISDIVKGVYPTEFGAGADEGTIESFNRPGSNILPQKTANTTASHFMTEYTAFFTTLTCLKKTIGISTRRAYSVAREKKVWVWTVFRIRTMTDCPRHMRSSTKCCTV